MVKYIKLHIDKLKLSKFQKSFLNKVEVLRVQLNYKIKNIDWQGYQIVYQDCDNTYTIQLSMTNYTVTTNLYHPKLGFTSKIRNNCSVNDMLAILASPRAHLITFKTKTIKHGSNRKTI